MKTFRDFITLNEATTLTKLGATKEQIKAIYRDKGKVTSGWVINANTEFKKYKNKKEIIEIMKSNEAEDIVVVGFDKKGIMTTAIQTPRYYEISVIDTDGTILRTFEESNATKTLSHFQGIKEYYVANKSGVFTLSYNSREYEKRSFTKDPQNMKKMADMVEKILKPEFERLVKLTKEKAKEAIDNGDYNTAIETLKKLTGEMNLNNYFITYKEIDFKKAISNNGWDADLSKEIARAIDNELSYDKEATEADILKAAAKILKDKKELLKQIFKL